VRFSSRIFNKIYGFLQNMRNNFVAFSLYNVAISAKCIYIKSLTKGLYWYPSKRIKQHVSNIIIVNSTTHLYSKSIFHIVFIKKDYENDDYLYARRLVYFYLYWNARSVENTHKLSDRSHHQLRWFTSSIWIWKLIEYPDKLLYISSLWPTIGPMHEENILGNTHKIPIASFWNSHF